MGLTHRHAHREAFERVGEIDRGWLGSGPTEFLATRPYTLPASTKARSKWGNTAGRGAEIPSSAPYCDLSHRGKDVRTSAGWFNLRSDLGERHLWELRLRRWSSQRCCGTSLAA